MRTVRRISGPAAWALVLAACSAPAKQPAPVRGPFDEARLASHVRVLASDEFEGRAPSTAGEERTLAYLQEQFAAAGLQPGNDGSWVQPVPLVEITADPAMELVVRGAGPARSLVYGEDYMAWTKRVVERVELDRSDLVFVGYGVVAPEYGWDDYAGLDVRGKTVVALVNDPGFGSGDPDVFQGRRMTYYGRWTYKYEEAARQGAIGALLVHTDDAAGYPWSVVSGSWAGPQLDGVSADGNAGRCAVEGWLSRAAAETILGDAGLDLEAARAAALEPDFAARSLGQTVSVAIENSIRESVSHNVLGLLPGSERPDEAIVYMAHWDHLGHDRSLEGDGIYNGAVDNATGTAALIELARAFAVLEPAPRRSVLFLALTAEESGLLGSQHYASQPALPLRDTVAGINMDGLNTRGRTQDVVVVGHGSSELEPILMRAAAAQDRVVVPETEPEKGYFYRSDHFHFAKRGVPVLYAEGGIDSREHGPEWGRQRSAEYLRERYHQPSDEFDPDWDLAGAIEDVQLYFAVGRELAAGDAYPNWYEGNEFRALRDASRAAAGP